MARKEKENASWFRHQVGMRNHRKIRVLRSQFGIDGYAFWSFILEFLSEADNLRWKHDPLEVKLLAGDLGMATDRFSEILDECFTLELLAKDKQGNFYSPSLIEEMKPLFEMREKEREKKRKQRGDSEPGPLFTSGIVPAKTAIVPGDNSNVPGDNTTDKIRLDKRENNTTSLSLDSGTRAREESSEANAEPVRQLAVEREHVLLKEQEEFCRTLSARHREFADAWSSWQSYCDRKSIQLFPEVAIEHLRFLTSQPNPVECIRLAIREGWKAPFPAKQEQYQAARTPGVIVKPKQRVQEEIRVATPDVVSKFADIARNLIRGGPTHEPATQS